jgi:hypothetical protein
MGALASAVKRRPSRTPAFKTPVFETPAFKTQ